MTRKRGAPTTSTADRRSKEVSLKPESKSNWPTLSASNPVSNYVKVGLCFFCLRELSALQPGGLSPRHIEDQSPYCGERKL